MGSRGAYGFKIDGEYKITYNHDGSYLDSLGREIVAFIRNVGDWEDLKNSVREIVMVEEEEEVPAEWRKIYSRFENLSIGSRKPVWYCQLKHLQGGKILTAIKEGEVTHMPDAFYFLKDSLFCTFAYIIDLDTMTFKVYKGFQEKPWEKNEFGVEPFPGNGKFYYYPVKLMGTFSLNNIPDRWTEYL